VRTVVLILTGMAVAAFAAEPRIVPVGPISRTINQAVSVSPPVDPAALWQPLVRMSPQERANGQMFITANSPEARAVEAIWNHGEYDAAIAALQQWAEGANLRRVYVGFNWRVPIQSAGADWGPNVRVGTHESAYRVAFDRENSTGNLLVSSVCYAGANTNFIVDLSTDGGLSWTETHAGYWVGDTIIRDLEMTGSAGYEYVAHIHRLASDSAFCYRVDAATGHQVKMPDSSWYKTVLQTSVANDTIEEVAICDWDDQMAGADLYVVGGTAKHSVEAGYSGDQGYGWYLYTALDSFYWGGLDYCFNRNKGVDRYVFLSCLYYTDSTYFPAVAYYDNSWHGRNLPMPTGSLGSLQTTGIAAWKDTIFLAYLHGTATGAMVRCLVSYDTFNTVNRIVDLTDSAHTRENLAICGRLGDGVSVVWRDYAGGGRWVGHRHSDYVGETWTGPDTASDHRPDWADRPRVQRVAPGVYGVCYITLEGGSYSLWFSRTDWIGIAGPRPERAVPMSLVAATRRDGARLNFTNPVSGPVRLAVYDAVGRRVLYRTELLKAGAQMLDCAVPASGSYIAVLKTAAASATAKFSVVR